MNPVTHSTAAVAALALAACNTPDTRIAQHGAAFAALDTGVQKDIRAGVVRPGYTMEMVTLARGQPTSITTDAAGRTIWSYRVEPVTAHDETIRAGFRRRVVYDPVKRSDDVVIEPIDAKAFPHLVRHVLRFTFENGRLLNVERTNQAW